jgi:hypothetical protein
VSVVAGVDVGNTTTEVVLVRTGEPGTAVEPLAWDRAPTRGAKGAPSSLHGATVLLRRLERRAGTGADLVAIARLRPVRTAAASLAQPAPSTGRLVVVDARGGTTGGSGTGVGRPARVMGSAPGPGPVVAVAPRGTGYEVVAARLTEWMAAGVDVRAVLLGDDEGVLVAARLPVALPVADEVDVARLDGAEVVAVELRPPGHRLVDVADPIRLTAQLGLDAAERADAVAVAEALGDRSRAVVGRFPAGATAPPGVQPSPGVQTSSSAVVLLGGTRAAVDPAAVRMLRGARPGTVASWQLPGWDQAEPVDDVWGVDLRELAASVAARTDVTADRSLVVAGLRSVAPDHDAAAVLQAELGVPVLVAGSEAVAARQGALTTPGVGVSATVVDVGGGTVDVIAADGDEAVVAGAGEMLTVVVATLLGLPRGAADWVKRVPSVRVEGPQRVLAEDGTRAFLERPVPATTVGSLAVPGPAGLLPFGGRTAPAEWRALRLRAKERVLLDNVARALSALAHDDAGDVLLVGGAAADDELVGLLRPVLGGRAVGRGDVAGRLGHRYAVAYGLALLATSS